MTVSGSRGMMAVTETERAMSHAEFVHLRVHSAYSLAEGAIHAKQLVKLAKKNRMPAVAMTDSGNMFGPLEFAVAAAAEGVEPLVGVDRTCNRMHSSKYCQMT